MKKSCKICLVLVVLAMACSLTAMAQSSDRAPEAASAAEQATAVAPASVAIVAPTPAAAPSADVRPAVAPTPVAHARSADARAAIAPAAAPTMLIAQAATPAAAPSADVKSSPTPEAKPVPTEMPRYFRFDFVLKEVDERKVINSRTYTLIMAVRRPGNVKYDPSASNRSSIRSGNRIAIVTGSFGTPGTGAALNTVQNQYQYIDVGVNIDVSSPVESQGELMMDVRADVSNTPGGVDANTSNPSIRQTRWESSVVVPIGKPTTLFSSDDIASKRTFQLELNATPIK